MLEQCRLCGLLEKGTVVKNDRLFAELLMLGDVVKCMMLVKVDMRRVRHSEVCLR